MTDPLRDALRECEAYLKERVYDAEHWNGGDMEKRLLGAVQAALRTPRINLPAREMVSRVAEIIYRAELSSAFDHEEIARRILAATEPSK